MTAKEFAHVPVPRSFATLPLATGELLASPDTDRNHSDDQGKCNRPDERVAWYDPGPMARLGIDGGRKTTEHRTDRPAYQREQSGFGDELNADLAASRPESAWESDLSSPLEHRDDHHVRDSDSTDEQRHATEREKQALERCGGVSPGNERVGRIGDADVLRCRGVGRSRKDRRDRCDAGGVRSHINLDWRGVRSKEAVGDFKSDQGRPIELGCKRHGVEDSNNCELMTAEPHRN